MSPLLWACDVVSFLALLQHVDEYNICLRQQAQITLVTTVQIKAERIMARLLMDLHGPVFYWPYSVFLTKAYACWMPLAEWQGRGKKKKNKSGFPRCPHRNLGDTPRCLPPAGIVRGGCPTTHILTAHLVKRRVSWKQWWGLYVTRRDRVRFGVTVITTQPPRCHGSRTQVRPVVLLQALPDPRVLQQSPSAVVLYKQLLQGQKYIELDNIYFIFGFSKQIFAILEIFCKFRFMIIIFHTVAITVTTENLLR